MVNLLVVFYMFVILFSVIGAMRGWAQEMLVTFSVILAFFLVNVLETVVLAKYAEGVIADKSPQQFWLRVLIVSVLVFFGYQTPRISRFASAARKDKISDSFLGFFLGAINGYLFAGTLWFYMAYAGYPFKYFANPELLLSIDINPPAQAAIDFI
ncbi:MAG: CvpA family protein, partial [Anaerolineales bacterium]|nr:CvpA family protein [Anaerolineales bacterium]